jgi:hypothetical protein
MLSSRAIEILKAGGLLNYMSKQVAIWKE